VLCQSSQYHSLDSNSFSCLDMWYVLPTRDDVVRSRTFWTTVDHRSYPYRYLYFQPLFSSFFFKEPIVEPFCPGNATIVGASLETKTRPYHLSDRKRRTHMYAWEKETGELREWKKRASVNATEGLFSSGSSFSPRHDPPFATRATSLFPEGRR